MRYVFQADASPSIGSGHVMRSSAIAEEFISRGDEVIFAGKISGLNWVEQRISSLGFSEIYSDLSVFSPNRETDILILDSYTLELDNSFLNPNNWYAVITIVDPVTPPYEAILRIHPGLNSDWYENKNIPILSGPRYIPLRKGILTKNAGISKDIGILNILVSSGGTDSLGLVSAVAQLLSETKINFKAYLFTNHCSIVDLDSRFEILAIGQELDSFAKIADLVFTTASTSAIEFIAMGLPVGVICSVENQESYYSILGKLKIAAQVGLRNESDQWVLNHNLIQKLIVSHKFREKFSTKATGLIDTHGASRLVDAIKKVGGTTSLNDGTDQIGRN